MMTRDRASASGEVLPRRVRLHYRTPSTNHLAPQSTTTASYLSNTGPLIDGCVLTSAARSNNGEQLVVTDGYGRIRLFQYPAVNDDQV